MNQTDIQFAKLQDLNAQLHKYYGVKGVYSIPVELGNEFFDRFTRIANYLRIYVSDLYADLPVREKITPNERMVPGQSLQFGVNQFADIVRDVEYILTMRDQFLIHSTSTALKSAQSEEAPPLKQRSAKPRLFIGSSAESLEVAFAVQEELDHDLEVTVWTQNVFELSSSTLESLIATLDKHDAALFVFSPEDEVKLRDTAVKAVRDNVIFEFGLFMGKMGRERCFFLMPTGVKDFHLPTDLFGITAATYNPNRTDNNLRAAVAPACNQIKRRLAT